MHHRLPNTPSTSVDDADVAAGEARATLESPPISMNSVVMGGGVSSDLEFFDDLVSEPVLVLGFDISHLSRQVQFSICASGVFFFSLLYGYLQELISVQLCNRKLGLFLAMIQFSGYTILAYILRQFVYERQKSSKTSQDWKSANPQTEVPIMLYLGLSLLRAVDLGMTNLAMQFINYPAKTLMKSSRVVFTMIFGVLIQRKLYRMTDYLIVLTMVLGLAIFMHADAKSSAVFHHIGVGMLTVSLVCDGAITNMSETIMSRFGVGQDEVSLDVTGLRTTHFTLHCSVSLHLFPFLLFDSSYFECTRSH
jgi:adenosine 3'-phospho 5'-phosphosulfate transporter B3